MTKKKKNSAQDNYGSPLREIEIIRLASDGAGIGFINGKATFVPGMLPEERGKIRLTEDKKTYQKAIAVDIYNYSDERQSPPCLVYNKCGGCNLQHLNYQYTLYWKRQWVEDALTRIGGLQNVYVEPVLGMEEPWRYRNKAVLHRDKEGRFGYYGQLTNDVVQFTDCLLLSKNTNKRITKLQKILGKCCPEIKTVTLRESNRGKALLLLDGNLGNNSEGKEGEPDRQKIDRQKEELNSKIKELIREEDFTPSVCSITTPQDKRDYKGSGTRHLNEYIDNIRFGVSPRSFLQVNPEQTAKLYSLILEFAELGGKEEVWDLYCGIGTITLILAKRARRVVGIEENLYATQDAIENAKANNIPNVSIIQGKVEEKLNNLSGVPDLVVTDPPRAGMNQKTVARLLKIRPKKIIYVSCNPATLARDLKALAGSSDESPGIYKIEKVQPVDMFPWTVHVECVIGMQRKDT